MPSARVPNPDRDRVGPAAGQSPASAGKAPKRRAARHTRERAAWAEGKAPKRRAALSTRERASWAEGKARKRRAAHNGPSHDDGYVVCGEPRRAGGKT